MRFMILYYLALASFASLALWHFGTIALRVYREHRQSLLHESYLDLLIETIINKN